MAFRRNIRIILAAVFMTTRSPHQRISFTGLSGHPLGRPSTTSRHSDRTCITVSSCSPQRRHAVVANTRVALGPPGGACVSLLHDRFVQRHSLADFVINHLSRRLHEHHSSLDNCAALQSLAVPRCKTILASDRVSGFRGCGIDLPSFASPSSIPLPRTPTWDGIHWTTVRTPSVFSW
ncbi:Xaa-pro dipeptidase [Plakobranchus ocellatus]|uniref:Xaa-pro dipeptidase n=1 Tax=Plakobranchus ocellatus TaxID=259542 RepID=A0AAV4A451_9GAST|nr:Xaa-pro dipeptidase [Plakobranchus ocellatus]